MAINKPMRNLLTLTALVAFAFVLGCARPEAISNVALATPAPAAPVQEDAPRISLENAKKGFDDGTAIFIDARPEDTYRDEHLKGAINVISDTLKAKLKDLPKDKTIVVYCS